ncbi:MAG TPA: hypothetical protein PKA81_08095 [Clostridia bacterium]|nr:hypothetical protein [Clostridia bacterium]
MSMLEELNTIVENVGLPVETGVFSKAAPAEYVVITPISEHFELFADNAPGMNIEEARLSLFSKGNYGATKDLLVRMLLSAGFLVTERRYIGYEEGTNFHHFSLDVAHEYEQEEL